MDVTIDKIINVGAFFNAPYKVGCMMHLIHKTRCIVFPSNIFSSHPSPCFCFSSAHPSTALPCPLSTATSPTPPSHLTTPPSHLIDMTNQSQGRSEDEVGDSITDHKIADFVTSRHGPSCAAPHLLLRLPPGATTLPHVRHPHRVSALHCVAFASN